MKINEHQGALTFRLTAGGSDSKFSSQYADMIQGVNVNVNVNTKRAPYI
jgi:hypothetical protein